MLALRIAHPNLVATYRANVRTLEDTAAPGGGGQQQFQITGDITPSYQLFLLQEFCDSGTLYDWLSRERMHPGNTPDQVCRHPRPPPVRYEQGSNMQSHHRISNPLILLSLLWLSCQGMAPSPALFIFVCGEAMVLVHLSFRNLSMNYPSQHMSCLQELSYLHTLFLNDVKLHLANPVVDTQFTPIQLYQRL